MNWIRRIGPYALASFAIGSGCTDDGATESASNEGGASEPTSTSAPPPDGSGETDTATASGCWDDVVGATSDGASESVMQTWGAACTTDQDCIDLIGDPAAICDTSAVVYELPGGFCTKPCVLPDPETRFVIDAADCDPAGGVTCIGSKGIFERCAVLCTDDTQCDREGYFCRQMPLIAEADDPKACLMDDCCDELSCQ